MIITLTIHERRIIFQILNLIMTADLIVKQDEIDYMDEATKESLLGASPI